MDKIKVYNQSGEVVGEARLSPDIFGVQPSPDLLHQVVVALTANKRQILAHTKDRSEVSGGGKKPWKQKGTGRARHGSSRSPIWVGGGVTFGPRNSRNFTKRLNKKMKRKALFMVLSDKVNEENMIILDKISFVEGKTKEAVNMLNKLPLKKQSAMVVDDKKNPELIKSTKNLKNTWSTNVNSIEMLDLLKYQYLVITQEAVKKLEKIYISDLKK